MKAVSFCCLVFFVVIFSLANTNAVQTAPDSRPDSHVVLYFGLINNSKSNYYGVLGINVE